MTTSLSREGVVADEGGVQKLNRYQIAREVIREFSNSRGILGVLDILKPLDHWLDQQQAEPDVIQCPNCKVYMDAVQCISCNHVMVLREQQAE